MPPNITNNPDLSNAPSLNIPWNSIKSGSVPKENQPVWYFFMGNAYEGFYEKCKEPEYGTHVFYGAHGFLTDDVDLWLPRQE